MSPISRIWLVSIVTTVLAGCAGSAAEDGPVSAASSALITENALVPNALVPNALVPNALVPNALVPNALAPGALAASARASLLDPGLAGDLSRMHLKYTVGCALSPGQSFSFSWIDSSSAVHNETYVGLLGLAPYWIAGPLDSDRQQMISACLATRTNYYGIPVMISVRGPGLAQSWPDVTETTTYAKEEGAFWGNIYTSTPALYACHQAADDANSRALYRDCAAGHQNPGGTISPCGIIRLVGPCDQHCLTINNPGFYHVYCWSDQNNVVATATQDALTVYLP